MPASDAIPPIALPFVSDKAKKTLDLVEKFVQQECIPSDTVYHAQLGEGEQRWKGHPSIVDDLKERAKKLGLWNMFLPRNHFKEGAGFSNLEYGLMAECLGKSRVASEATNCAAPDTGNMEVLAKYGSSAQKQKWLTPLLNGEIRSAFLMTEPDVASSDATNIQLTMRRDGDEWVLNGSKWWSSGAGDHRCKVYIVMGKSSPNEKNPYRQQSVVLVPADAKGITIHRMLHVYGYDDAPHGHGHISFKDVRVKDSDAMVLGEGRGFEIIQGRLGPGRIHHAMRTIGAAELALEWLIARINDERKTTFGQPLSSHGVLLEWIARSRLEIDAARLVVLNAAIKIDGANAKAALKEIAEAKVLVPSMALAVIDRAVQAYGGMGICQDTPLANMWAQIRTLRIADGPDEVHLQQMAKRENKDRRDEVIKKLEWQRAEADRILERMGLKKLKSHLYSAQQLSINDSPGVSVACVQWWCTVIIKGDGSTLLGFQQSQFQTRSLLVRGFGAGLSKPHDNLSAIERECTALAVDEDRHQQYLDLEYTITLPTNLTTTQPHPSPNMSHSEDAKSQSQSQSYISPSDTIMSPTTKKLCEIKGKRFASGKPQSLFAKTVERQVQTNGQAQAQAGTQAQGQAQGQIQIQTRKGQDGGGGEEGKENDIAESKTAVAGEESRVGLTGAEEMR